MYWTTTYASPVGTLTLASRDGTAVSGLWLEGQKYFGGKWAQQLSPLKRDCPAFRAGKMWLDRYFAGLQPDGRELPIAPEGTRFQLAVWELLRKIPYGKITTYGALAQELACSLGKPSLSPQAVGGAVGHNPISILVPCHRVVGSHGNLTGYAGGLERKIWLLQHEGVGVEQLIRPRQGTAL